MRLFALQDHQFAEYLTRERGSLAHYFLERTRVPWMEYSPPRKRSLLYPSLRRFTTLSRGVLVIPSPAPISR
jgi:hypothetical protein